MSNKVRYLFVGTVIGALVGALGGLAVERRFGASAGAENAASVARPLDGQGALRVLWSVVGVVRQLVEL